MENENKSPDPVPSETWDSMLEDGGELKRKKTTFFLRIIGFLIILVSFGILMVWRSGVVNPVLRKIALGLGVLGFVLYFGTRLYEIATPRFKNRKHA